MRRVVVAVSISKSGYLNTKLKLVGIFLLGYVAEVERNLPLRFGQSLLQMPDLVILSKSHERTPNALEPVASPTFDLDFI